jgi:hypothetical protein
MLLKDRRNKKRSLLSLRHFVERKVEAEKRDGVEIPLDFGSPSEAQTNGKKMPHSAFLFFTVVDFV